MNRKIELAAYAPRYEQVTLDRIARFWGFHGGLVGVQEEDACCVREDLTCWTGEGHCLYVILEDGTDVGFVHLYRAGPIVMELADLFVDECRRGRGIATAAIALAEAEAKATPGVEAMILQVVTRNERALRLYHHLGYDTMSTVTLRKEFGKNRRDQQAQFLGLLFHI